MSRAHLIGASLVVASSLMARPQVAGQSQFQAAAEFVRVYATVKDKDGHLIAYLRQDEFDLLDRGTRAPLTVFSTDPQPIAVAVLVDMSGALFEAQTYELLRRGLTAFVDRLGSQDRARIGWFTKNEVVLGLDLTSERLALKDSIMKEIRPERAHPNVGNAPSMLAVRWGGRPLWNAIGSAIQSMTKEPGRKVVLVLANGPDTLKLPGLPGLKEIRSAIPTDEYMVYAVNGFEPRHSEGLRGSQYEDAPVADPQNTLEDLTESTGGGFLHAPFDPRKRGFGMAGDRVAEHPLSPAFASMLAGIADELHHQYMLGFVPTRRDGKVGKIEVRVTRPGMKIWARRTYLAPKE